ncbi:MAG: hypothetical protein IKE04_03965 [Oscillospiraceae bacterium]|nr:hypothetical protein [Oscillospiraceae bacterium]
MSKNGPAENRITGKQKAGESPAFCHAILPDESALRGVPSALGLFFCFFAEKYKNTLDIPPCGSLTMTSQSANMHQGKSK